jgi:RNA polymerase sigma factor (sigma-70 family)
MSSPPTVRDPSANIEQTRWFAEEAQPHEAAVRGYLRNRFPSVDIDDVVQESYLRLLKARTAGTIASTRAYLFSIVRNTAITLFQREKIYSETPVSELPGWRVLDSGPGPADVTDAHQRLDLMSEAFDHLPPRCRDVLRLAVLRGLSNAEIAQELSLTENTVRVHLARGIKKSADYVRQQGERR